MIVSLLFILALIGAFIFVEWRFFVKMGEAGWKCLIPFYGTYVRNKAITTNGRLVVLDLVAQVLSCLAPLIMGIITSLSAMGSYYGYSYSSVGAAVGLLEGFSVGTWLMFLIYGFLYVMESIMMYKLAFAFDEDKAFGVVAIVAQLIAVVVLTFDDDCEYGGPVE